MKETGVMGDERLKPNLNENRETLNSLIKDIKVAMFTTLDEKGRMHSRPMVTQQTSFDGDLWFFSSASSHKISEIDWNRQVHLNYSLPDKNKYVSVTGTGEIVRSRQKAEELWNDDYRAWFPRGLSDPDLVLVRVEVDEAEFWESNSATTVQIKGFEQPRRIDLAG
jgi:general stress protein 26